MSGSSGRQLWNLRSLDNKKVGYIDHRGNWAIEPVFDEAHTFYGEVAAAKHNGRWGMVDKDEHWKQAPSGVSMIRAYGEGPVRARVGDKWGFLDERGCWLLEPKFSHTSYFSSGLNAVIHDGMYGCIDVNGGWRIEPQFKLLGPFSRGLAVAQLPGGKIGFIDQWGDWAIVPQFDSARNFQEELCVAIVGVKREGKGYLEGYIDAEGGWFLEPKFREAGWFRSGLAGARPGEPGEDYLGEHERWGFHDTAGEWVVEPRFQEVRYFAEGIAPVQHDESYGFIDMHGDWLLEPVLDVAWSAHNGLMLVGANRKYGFLNPAFDWVIAPIYDEAEDCDELIKVVADGQESYLDRTGRPVAGLAVQS